MCSGVIGIVTHAPQAGGESSALPPTETQPVAPDGEHSSLVAPPSPPSQIQPLAPDGQPSTLVAPPSPSQIPPLAPDGQPSVLVARPSQIQPLAPEGEPSALATHRANSFAAATGSFTLPCNVVLSPRLLISSLSADSNHLSTQEDERAPFQKANTLLVGPQHSSSKLVSSLECHVIYCRQNW